MGKGYKKDSFFKYLFSDWVLVWRYCCFCADISSCKKTLTISNVIYDYYLYANGLTGQSVHTKNPRCLDTFYIVEEILEVYDSLKEKMPIRLKSAMLRQLGLYVYSRTHRLGEHYLKCLFVMAAGLAEKYELLEKREMERFTFWERELCEAFINKQYYRWKLAAMMM